MGNMKESTSLPVPELLTMASRRKDGGRGSLLNRPTCPPPPNDPTGHRSELYWTEYYKMFVIMSLFLIGFRVLFGVFADEGF